MVIFFQPTRGILKSCVQKMAWPPFTQHAKMYKFESLSESVVLDRLQNMMRSNQQFKRYNMICSDLRDNDEKYLET